MPPKPDHAHRQLGRKLFAALLSEQLGIKSVDYTLRYHVPEELAPCWGEIGWQLQCHLVLAAAGEPPAAAPRDRRKHIHLVVDNTNLPF